MLGSVTATLYLVTMVLDIVWCYGNWGSPMPSLKWLVEVQLPDTRCLFACQPACRRIMLRLALTRAVLVFSTTGGLQADAPHK